MSKSDKTPASVRHGGPGASHENAKEPPETQVIDGKGKAGKRDVSGGEPDGRDGGSA